MLHESHAQKDAYLQTSDEASGPPVFAHLVLSIWNAFNSSEIPGQPSASCWNEIPHSVKP